MPVTPERSAAEFEAELRALGTPKRAAGSRRYLKSEPLGQEAEFARFATYADAMLDESEFFIRKANGWVLRETGKRRPDEVYDWLAPRTARAAGVTMREAVEYLDAARGEELMRAHRERRPMA